MYCNKIIKYQCLAKRRFGVELEINNTVTKDLIIETIDEVSEIGLKVDQWAQSRNNSYWHIKEDTSCGLIGRGHDHGWEVASYVGSGKRDVDHIGMVSQSLKNAGCETNENCGLHVHIEIDDFDCYQVGVLLGHYAKFEWLLQYITPSYRHINQYCKQFVNLFAYEDRRVFWSPAKMWMWLKPHNLSPNDNVYRWRSVNLVNYVIGLTKPEWGQTIEFRLPDCTLLKSDVKNWIRLFVNFVEWVKGQDMPDDIDSVPIAESLWHLGLGHNDKEFCILDKDLFDTKTWLLKKFIRLNKHDRYLKKHIKEPKKMLNLMWSPVKTFV